MVFCAEKKPDYTKVGVLFKVPKSAPAIEGLALLDPPFVYMVLGLLAVTTRDAEPEPEKPYLAAGGMLGEAR